MFRHLKPGELVDLMEGQSLPPGRKGHFEVCGHCQARFGTIKGLRQTLDRLDSAVPEVDWDRFRWSVHDRLLSRTVQRSSVLHRWVGLPLRPVMVWTFLVFLTASAGTLALVRYTETDRVAVRDDAENELGGRVPAPRGTSPTGATSGDDVFEQASMLEAEVFAWSYTSIFAELGELEPGETERLRELLALTQQGAVP